MLERIWTRLTALDAGVKIAGLLFVLSAALLAFTGGAPPPEEPRREAGRQAKPAKPANKAEREARNKDKSGHQPAVKSAHLEIVPTGLVRLGIATMDFPLGHPMDVEVVDGKLFVVTRDGLVTWYDPQRQTFVEIAAVEMNRTTLEGSRIRALENFKQRHFRTFGLLVEPDGDGWRAYIAHHLFEDGCFNFRVSVLRFTLGEAARAEGKPETLYAAEPCIPPLAQAGSAFAGNQAGGRMIPFDDDHFLITIGDHALDGVDADPVPLEPTSPYGKVMLIDKRSGEAEIYASGVRNPQGMIRTARGEILSAEHGPKGGDELNLIERGKVYGWPDVTYGIDYGWKPWPMSSDQGQHEGYEKPLYAWLPSIGVSNLAEVADGAFPLWRGDLLVTSLKEQTLYRLRRADGRIVYEEPIPIGHRIRDIEPLESGELVLVTDDRKIIVLLDAGAVFAETKMRKGELARLMPFVVRSPKGGAIQLTGEELFDERCGSCHGVDGETLVSVPLDGLFERTIGAFPGYEYSTTLAEDERQWDARLFKQFLLRPKQAFPGTTMPKPNVTRDDVDALIDHLRD